MAIGEVPSIAGTCSWSAKSWVASFYPKGMPPGDFLDYYATQFDTVDVDASRTGR